ncbi:hypothetical protein MMC20_002162 [Loxospora ochrophaea]|nr:hypothetical protein [Loxospora ochrophaea]
MAHHGPQYPALVNLPEHYPRKRLRWVWPKDKKLSHWERMKDIAKSRGPGIWVNRVGDRGPSKPVWSNWKYFLHGEWNDNLGWWNDGKEAVPIGGTWNGRKYDFRSRKYRFPRPGDLSNVKWAEYPGAAYYYTTAYGGEDYLGGPGWKYFDGYEVRRQPFRNRLGGDPPPWVYNDQGIYWTP